MNLITELVIANRILANEDVVDAYGHVSVRNPEAPERFFLATSKSPALVEAGDIVENTLDARPRLRRSGASADRRREHVGLPASQCARAIQGDAARRAQAPERGRDPGARRRHRLQAAIAGDAARLAVLGAARRLPRSAKGL